VSNPLDISAIRQEYSQRRLRRADLHPDPIAQFNLWLAEAIQAKIKDPNAMALATVNPAGQPSSRIVLLKGVTQSGFLFFTNYTSRKAAELAAHPHAALNLFWPELERQVCIQGAVAKASRREAETYFKTRPLASQLGAWASRQSQIVPSRHELEEQLASVTARFAGQQVPLPDFWGGYCLTPSSIEFWQGGPARIHDRLRYQRTGPAWQIDRLSP
jgi:pyridoxamine 5'-phosphate oxidase